MSDTACKLRVTFTDWKGSLIVYFAIWLVPLYFAFLWSGNLTASLVMAPFIYLTMMAQHKLHRAVKLTTAAKYEEIDEHREWRWFWYLLIAAGIYDGFVVAPLCNTLASTLAAITAVMIFLYSGPLHREWWIGVCYFMGFLACYTACSGGQLPHLWQMLVFAGISSWCVMLHKGLRIVTGDYGQVPVEFRHIVHVFIAWVVGLVLLLLGLGVRP